MPSTYCSGLKVEGGKVRGLTKKEEVARDWEKDPFEGWGDEELEGGDVRGTEIDTESPSSLLKIPPLSPTRPSSLLPQSSYVPSIQPSLSVYEEVALEARELGLEVIKATAVAAATMKEDFVRSHNTEDKQVLQLDEVRTSE